MTEAHRKHLRSIMETAWTFQRSEPTRAFADCLRGAWKWVRGMAATAKAFMDKARRNGGRVNFGSPVTSPTRRAVSGHRNPGYADWQAAGMTGRVSS